jgi:hypothetical protein
LAARTGSAARGEISEGGSVGEAACGERRGRQGQKWKTQSGRTERGQTREGSGEKKVRSRGGLRDASAFGARRQPGMAVD